MSLVIKPKRKETTGAPTASDLAVGELAMNLADTQLYSKKADGTVVTFTTSGDNAFFAEEVDLGTLANATTSYDSGGLTGGSPNNTFTGLEDLVEDTTPQLGGNLDLNSSDITGTGNIDITGNADLTGTTTQGATDYYTKQYVLYGTTTDATETEVLIGGSTRISVPSNTTMFYEVSIVSRRTDATGESGAWHLKGCADNFSDTVADVGDVYEIAVAQDDVNMQVDVRADDTNDAINVFVTGVASKTIRWTAIVKTIEVAE